jgi:uncharacterized membrane protein
MNIGASIFLMAVGAILTFALDVSVSGIDIKVVGVILMIAGLALLAVDLMFWGPRRRAGAGSVVEERQIYDDRPPL